MAKKRPTVAEKKWMQQVADYGCIACEIDGKVFVPCEIHHIRKHTGMGLRPSHFNILPLCASHHRTGKISVHLGKKAFESKYGTEEQLQKQLRERIEEWNAIVGIF
tara:strand:- start:247 stop:564 length:318 start_codon:yes stop_codon:yes gene_type:complete